MGEFARAVQDRLRDRLAERRSGFAWSVEYRIGGTAVDVAGVGDRLIAIELEWRRADPADNTAALFRHVAGGDLSGYDHVEVVQVFSAYYDLASGGVSSKRENAAFVGRVAAASNDRWRYHPVEFPLDPPKRGGDRPDGWRERTDAVADRIADAVA